MIFFTQPHVQIDQKRGFFPLGLTRTTTYQGQSYSGSIHFFLHNLLKFNEFEFLTDPTLKVLNLSGNEEAPHELLHFEGVKKSEENQKDDISVKIFTHFDSFPSLSSIAFKARTEKSKNIYNLELSEVLKSEEIEPHSLTLHLTAFRGAASGFFGVNPDSFGTLKLTMTENHYLIVTNCFFKHFKEINIESFGKVLSLITNSQ